MLEAPFSWPNSEHFTLSNGLRTIVTELPHVSLLAVTLFVRVGSRFERVEDNGLSHLLEHVVFRGSSRYPDTYALNTAIERVSSGLDAATSRDFTTYETSCLPSKLAELLAIVADMLARPTFEGVGLETRIITEELQDEIDAKGRDIDPDNLAKMKMYAGSSMGRKVGGLIPRVQRFSEADCRRWHAQHYCGANMVLAIAGPLSKVPQWQQAVQDAFHIFPEGTLQHTEAAKVREDLPAFEFTRHVSSQAEIHLTWSLPPEDHPDFPALLFAQRVMDDGTCARLRHRIVDQLGLAYHASADLETYEGLSVLTVSTQTRPNQAVAALDALIEVVEQLGREPISTEEFERMRSRVSLELSTVNDSPSAASFWSGLRLLYPSSDSLLTRLQRSFAVTPAGLLEAVRRHLSLSQVQLTVVGDVEPLARAALRRRIQPRRKAA